MLAIVLAVLSLAGRTVAAPTAAVSFRAISAAPAEWHPSASVTRAVERAHDASAGERDARGLSLLPLPVAASWHLAAPSIVRELSWSSMRATLVGARPDVAAVARGPPTSLQK